MGGAASVVLVSTTEGQRWVSPPQWCAAPTGLAVLRLAYPALTRWASLCRRSAARCSLGLEVVRLRSAAQDAKSCCDIDLSGGRELLNPETFLHQSLQARFVEDVESEFLAGEHGERRATGIGREFGRFFNG